MWNFSAEMTAITSLGKKVSDYSQPPVKKIENKFFSRHQVTLES